MASNMSVKILVDFGMTASAAECFVTQPLDKFWPIRHHKFGKQPTRLLYEANGKIAAWGPSCENSEQAKEGFKEGFGSRILPYNRTNPPPTFREVKKWTSDFLHCFCGEILRQIRERENWTTENLNAKWYLTTPGAWTSPARLDFKMVADNALTNLLPGSKVFLDLTESVASCEFLVDHLGLKPNTWALTCDIGGVTCDTALAIIDTNGGRPVPQVFAISGNRSGGVECINHYFEAMLSKSLHECRTVRSWEVIIDVMRGAEWRHARHAFDGSSDIVLTAKSYLGRGKDSRGEVSVHGLKIVISSTFMERVFEPFLEILYAEIDESLNSLMEKTSRRTKPNVIALSGGGATMAYPLKMLKVRYDIDIQIPPSTEESCLATVVGHRIYRVRQDIQDYLSEIIVGVSSLCTPTQPPYTIIWKDSLSTITTFEFFSRKENILHYVIVRLKACIKPRPISFNILKKAPSTWKGILVWALDVTLDRHKLQRTKYLIEVQCTGTSTFSFRAYDAKCPSTSFPVVSDKYFLDN